MRLLCLLVLSSAALFCGVASAETRPNIVFILADDLGYTDIEPFGGEVKTPALTALAKSGVRFTNYHTAANCAPSRAMLLTGVNNHKAGVPNIPEMIAPEQRVYENYQGVLGDNVVTVATLLESAGYRTYMAGKWHLGAAPDKLPSRRGFQRTVALMDSGADNWEQRPYLPIYEEANWFADGERFELPEDFYSSTFLVDKMIEFIDSGKEGESPFFAYLPFQAVHMPVQAPQQFIDRHMGAYDEGWDVLRQRRQEQAIALGIVPRSDRVRMGSTRDWDSLTDEQKRMESKRMAVYAAMIEAMDFNIGRLIAYLKAEGKLDNTIFIFTSDNGAEASGADDLNSLPFSLIAGLQGYNTDYETLGLKGSYSSISPSFSSAAVSPLSYYKFYAGEGGMRVPLIISGTPLSIEPRLTAAFSWATDITPTILSMAGVPIPGDRYRGRPIDPPTGKNLLPLIKGETERVYGEGDSIGYELTGHSALFQGDYKLVRNQPPQGDGLWYLYDIVRDPGETADLKAARPETFDLMLAAYNVFARENGVAPLPPGYNPNRQVLLNAVSKRYGTNILVTVIALLVLLPFLFVMLRRRF